MKSVYSELSNNIPIRPRVAFVLALAERVMPALRKNTDAFNAVQKALTDAWRWEQGENIEAEQLYDDDDEALVLQGCLVKEKEGHNAIMAATLAFYYALWHANLMDIKMGRVRDLINTGVAEVDEDVIGEACEYAIQTSLCDNRWITAMVDRLLNDFRAASPDELGPVVLPQYFQ